MGRWMEVLTVPCIDKDYDERIGFIVAECTPHPLIEAARAMDANEKKNYPQLCYVGLCSPAYTDESLWLQGLEIQTVLEEFRTFIGNHPISSDNLERDSVLEKWMDPDVPCEVEMFSAWVEKIKQMLAMAIQNQYVVHLML